MKSYDLASVFLVIGGYTIGGYGEGGAIEFEFPTNDADYIVGADGQVVVSRTNDKTMICRITVLETSRSSRDLDALAVEQHSAGGEITPLAFLCRDQITGDEISEASPVFLKRGAPSKGKSVGDRTFEILLPAGRSGFVAGASIVL